MRDHAGLPLFRDVLSSKGSRSLRRFYPGALLLIAAALVFAKPAGAQTQVTLYLNNYGTPAPAPPTAPVQGAAPSTGSLPAGTAALAQLAAYQQYLLYVAAVNQQVQQAREGVVPNAGQYFTNGAAVMTVPSAGPGSAYFSNGAEATRMPPPASSVAAAGSAPSAAPSAQPPGAWWWTDSPAAPSTAQAPAPPPPPQPASVAPPVTQEPAMSFDEWLQSMGITLPEAQAAESAPPALADTEPSPIVAEPSATALDVRQRTTFDLPEKTRARVATNGSSGVEVFALGAFAVGLVAGALAMRRTRMGVPPTRGTTPGE